MSLQEMVTNTIDENSSPRKPAVGDGDDQQNLVCGLWQEWAVTIDSDGYQNLQKKLTKNIQTIPIASRLKPGELGGAMTNDGH